jgi:hypothetical protein
MTTIATQRNRVITEQPEPDDVMVEVILFGEGDTPGTVAARKLRHLPIAHYQECLDWAVGIADQMARPIYVVPLNHSDIFNTNRWTPYRDCVANMNDQQWGELRRVIVATCCEIMRDCDEWEVRADAYDILTKLKVIRHEG